MKTKLILTNALMLSLLFSFGAKAANETNWTQLIRDMRSIEKENVRLNNGRIEFSLAKIPGGAIRLLGFKFYNSPAQVKLVINSKDSDLKKICEESLIFKRPFNATLTVEVAPIKDEFDFTLKDGRKFSTRDFQNPFTSEGTMASLVEGSTFSWALMHHSGKYSSLGGPGEALIGMINNALNEQQGDIVQIDLGTHNALACDLASEAIRLSFDRSIIHEKGLPETQSWIDQHSFAELFRSFWADRQMIVSRLSTEDMRSSEFILLGWNLADKNVDKNKMLRSTARVMNLFNALKHEKSGISEEEKPRVEAIKLEEHWSKTAEFAQPKVLTVKSTKNTSTGPVKLTIER